MTRASLPAARSVSATHASTAPPAIDAEHMVVRTEGGAITFTVHAADGTAILDAEGAAIAVRLLSWGEKSAIARFATAGGGFVEQQVLATCAPAAGGDLRDAALALARWLHAPAGDALPFDPALLAQATARLGAWWRLRPDELAALPAPSVEALWRALDGSGAAAPDPYQLATSLFSPRQHPDGAYGAGQSWAEADARWPRIPRAGDETPPVAADDLAPVAVGADAVPAEPQEAAPTKTRLRERLRFRLPRRTDPAQPPMDRTSGRRFDHARPNAVDPFGEADPAANPQFARLIAQVSREAELAAAMPDPKAAELPQARWA